MLDLTLPRLDADRSLLRVGATISGRMISADTIVRDADTGEAAMLVTRTIVSPVLRAALRAYPTTTTVRSGGIRNTSRVFGFSGRRVMMKRSACRSCEGARALPSAHAAICGAADEFARLLRDRLPDRAARDEALVRSEVRPEWIIRDSWWTSGVVNLTSPLPYHFDGNNFDAWSAMLVVRRGVRGGHLDIPEYGVTVECRDGDVLLFNGSKLMHGVTPMRVVDRDGYRVSAVYYPVRGMAHCLAWDEEIAQAQRGRAAREDGLLERQRAVGMLTDG